MKPDSYFRQPSRDERTPLIPSGVGSGRPVMETDSYFRQPAGAVTWPEVCGHAKAAP